MTAPSERVACVTGATRGIGWETARSLAAEGHAVALTGREEATVTARADELAAEFGVETGGYCCDSADPQAVDRTFRAIYDRWHRLDVLVINAGVLSQGRLGMIPPRDIETTLAVNVAGSLYALQAGARLMARRKSGAIVLLSSIVATQGTAGLAVYSASKAAIAGLTRAAARELGPLGIRVNAVAPGLIDTAMLRQMDATVLGQRLSKVVLGRVGQPSEVAETIRYLASDVAGYVTGQVLGVDGGLVLE